MILPERVARVGFDAVAADFHAAAEAVEHPWEVAYAAYPRIGLRITQGKAAGKLTMVIEAPDWPHQPIEVVPCNGAFQPLLLDHIHRKADAAGVHHLVRTLPGDKVWFCVYGTKSFHHLYREHIPWEAIRHLPSNLPHQVLEACLNCIDLEGPWK